MGEHDGDSVTGRLKSRDEGMDIRGGFVGRWSIVVDQLGRIVMMASKV
jgi:hypothetical protein